MSDGATIAVPMRFAGVDLLVEAASVRVIGSEPTSVADRTLDAYQRAEAAIVGVAQSVAGTIARLVQEGRHPREVQVEFGLTVSAEGNIVVVKGAAEATLKVALTYATA
jgi:hypothetical protein